MIKFKFISDIYSFFTAKDRNLFHFLMFLILISTILELAGISMIIPLLQSFLSEDYILTNKFTNYIYYFFNFSNKNHFILFFSIFIFIFFLIKTCILIFIIRFTINFVNKLHYTLTAKLFEIYLTQDFLFYSKNNSSMLIRNTKDEIGKAIHGVILQFSYLVTEVLLVAAIIGFLLYIELFITIVALFYFVSINFTYFYFTKRLLFSWGKDRQFFEGLRIKNLMQAFSGIKEIKVNMSEKEFIDMYFSYSKSSITTDGKSNFVSLIPRLMFEFFSVIIFLFIILIIIFSGKSVIDFIPIIGVFAFAAFKLLPSFNKILNSLQLIRFSLPSLQLIKKEFILKKEIQNNNLIDKFSFKNYIDFQNVTFNFDDNVVLDNSNLKINKNDFVGIIGESGSGKTTIINLLLGLYLPSRGKIIIDDNNIKEITSNWKKSISIIPQEIFLLDDTIKRNIAFTHKDENINVEKVAKSLTDANLENFIKSLELGIETTVGERGLKISGGQKQRLGIARALYKDSDILIFDEATSNLDAKTENEIINTIMKLKNKKTIIFIAHRKNLMEYCNKVFEVKDNKINLIKNEKK